MPNERDYGYDASRSEDLPGRGEYGGAYEAPYDSTFHGYGSGYGGGALRSRGSYYAGQLRSGSNPRDEFEFEWGDGYVGGRGYGGTNYDLQHGYRIGSTLRTAAERYDAGSRRREPYARESALPADAARIRRGYESAREYPYPDAYRAENRAAVYGPARYGYGPYFERLQRRRRTDDEIRDDVEDALFYDTWVDSDRIDVAVDDGVVTLTGTLSSYDEVRYATDDAWDIDGVRGVRTELAVEAEPPARSRPRAQAAGRPAAAAAAAASAEQAPRAASRAARSAEQRKKAASPARGRSTKSGQRGKPTATAASVTAGAEGAASA